MINTSLSCPVNKNFLAKEIKKEQTTKSGLVLTTSHSEESVKLFEVIRTPTHHDLGYDINIGDTLVVQNNGYNSIPSFRTDPTNPDSTMFIIPQSYILMVIAEDPVDTDEILF